VERITGQALADALIDCLASWDLWLENLCGQAYDSASNMWGRMAARQREERRLLSCFMYTVFLISSIWR